MLDQYSRTKLLLGNDYTDKISQKKVAVFGLGGVGGNACDALARAGIMNFVIFDNDTVNITNINRQLVANTNNLNKYKVDVMEEHLKSINEGIEVIKHQEFYGQNSEFDFNDIDYIVDAIDTVSSKILLIEKANELNIPIVCALGCGNRLDPSKIKYTDIMKTEGDPLAKVLRYELRKRNIKHLDVIYSTEEPIKHKEESEEITNKRMTIGSSPFVPPTAGIMMAYVVIKNLLGNF